MSFKRFTKSGPSSDILQDSYLWLFVITRNGSSSWKGKEHTQAMMCCR